MWEKIRKLLKLEKEETTEERIARIVAEAPLTLEKYPELREKYEQDVIDGSETFAAIELDHRAYILERTRTDPEFAKEIKRQEEAAAMRDLIAKLTTTKCPFCGSTKIVKISDEHGPGSVMLKMAFARLKKEWACTSCGEIF